MKIEIDVDTKTLRETLCLAQTTIMNSPYLFDTTIKQHVVRLKDLVKQIDRNDERISVDPCRGDNVETWYEESL